MCTIYRLKLAVELYQAINEWSRCEVCLEGYWTNKMCGERACRQCSHISFQVGRAPAYCRLKP